MTVRAVDMQTMLPRLSEAGRPHAQAEAQPALTQHAQTARVAAQAERAQHQVSQKASPEQKGVRPDGGGQGKGGRERGNGQRPGARRDAEKSGQEAQADSGVGRRLDVKL
jgi:hypothetical protein